MFLLHANETLGTDRLIDELWGERPPASAAKTVQVYVSRLRKVLAGGAGDGTGVVVRRARTATCWSSIPSASTPAASSDSSPTGGATSPPATIQST